jgi:hypothetical protein
MSDQAELPYAGTEGWSGSDTSRERAYADATEGTAGKRQRAVLDLVSRQEGVGVTWAEVGHSLGLHHGQASATLSALHLAGRIERLVERRGRSQIYVLPQHVGDRQVAPHRSNRAHIDKHTVWEEGYLAGHDDGRHGTVTPNPYPEEQP